MKIILFIALIICMAAQVFAGTNHTVVTYVNLSDLAAGVDDTITVALGGQVAVNQGDTVRGILVGGGIWFSAGGNKIKTSGFSMTSGTTTLGPADTIEISNQNIFNTHDFYVGAGTANFVGSVANPVIIRTDPTTYGNASVMVTGASAVLNWSNVKFVNMSDPGSGLNTAGVNFQTRTTPTNNSITNMSGDTACFATLNCIGFKWNGGTINTITGQGESVISYGGSADSIMNVVATNYSGNAFYCVQNSTYYYGDTAITTNPSTGGYGWTLAGGTKRAKLVSCRATGFFANFAIPTNSRHDSATIIGSRFDGGAATHTQALLGLTKGTLIYGSQFYGGTTRFTLGTYDGSVVEDLKLYYNTIGRYNYNVKAPICFDCVTGYSCVATITGLEMVGNIVWGQNASFGNADIWVSGGLNVQLTRFQYNALDKIDTSSAGAHFAVPVGSWPGTNKVTSNFAFQDSLNGDFRLAAGSPMLNCADSALFVQYMGGVNQPGDIGYYQSNITGACGGVPTGACCSPAGSCSEVTGAQCTAGGGTYYGDGTTCPQTTCTPIPGTSGTGPAPRAKQLDIALLAYYAPMWQHNFGGYVPSMRDWAANRYSMIITTAGGSADSASMAYMKTVNPKLKIIGYDLYSRTGGDSANIAAFSASSGISVDSMFLRTGPQVADSAVVVGNTNTTASYTTPGGNKFIRMYMYAQDATHLRFLFDPRKWQFGSYLYHRFNTTMLDNGLDGIMMDEETRLTGLWPGNAGFQPYSAAAWPVGLDSIVSPFTGIAAADFPDSQVVWRDRWAQTLADSMAAHSKILIPNGASWWGIQASQADSGWKVEGRHATNIYGGAFLNETMTQFYSYGFTMLRYFPGYAYQMKDSAVNLVMGYWPVGWVDSLCQANLTLARQRQNFLGARLMCEFPRTNGSKFWMFPRWQSGQYSQDANDFYHNYTTARSYVCATMTKPSDSDWMWSDAWGKYFGTPMLTRDTSQAGTDGSGTAYEVWKAAFLDPGVPNGSDTLTFAAMRFPYGGFGTGIYGATTEINVTLPGSVAKVWYELIDNYGDSANIGAARTCFWKPVQQLGGSTFTLRNGQARIFSSDTLLGNSGVIDTTLSVSAANTTEGQNMVFTVTQNRALSNRNYFAWHTTGSPTGGTAQSNVDFTAQTDVIGSIGPGELTTTLTVPTTNDVLVEGTETFTVTINSQTYGTIVTGTATGTIIDNDAQGQPGTAKHFPKWRKKQ